MNANVERLTEERDLLLRSLEQLESEHSNGDLSEEDYDALRDSYTAQAAAVLRELERDGDGKAPGGDQATADGPPQRPSRLVGRWLLIGTCLAGFAVVAGLALARAAGERGVNDQLTGASGQSSRQRVANCQEMGSTGGDLLGSLQCFDEILDGDPDNAEALTYRGWYLLLAAGSLQQGNQTDGAAGEGPGDEEAQELLAAGLTYLDRAVEADPSLPDPLAFRSVVWDRLGDGDAACADVAALLELDPPPFFVQQTSGIAERNNC